MKWRSAILRAFEGNIEAVKAEIESMTTVELADKYSTTESTVRVWESMHGVHAIRVCRFCQKRTPHQKMAKTASGNIGVRCEDCMKSGFTKSRDYQRKVTSANRRARAGQGGTIAEEIRALPPIILQSPRLRMSRMQGHWNRYSEELWATMLGSPAHSNVPRSGGAAQCSTLASL